MKVEEAINLKNINLSIKKGEFVCIIGEVGSGKSSLISSILGDMIYVPQEAYQNLKDLEMTEEIFEQLINYSKEKGIITATGSISFVQQIPWIQNRTI
jgi:ATP-binding cassette subfamily C (CFTR/MRP) protein 1